MQAEALLKNPNSLNLTDILPNGVTFSNPKFFNNMASNVTSTSKVLLPSIMDGLRPSLLAATGCNFQRCEFNPGALKSVHCNNISCTVASPLSVHL